MCIYIIYLIWMWISYICNMFYYVLYIQEDGKHQCSIVVGAWKFRVEQTGLETLRTRFCGRSAVRQVVRSVDHVGRTSWWVIS